MKRSVKYAQIYASIRELGTIEPPAVIRDEAVKGKYIMLDGHLRLEAFKDLGYAHIVCLVATEDEAFTLPESKTLSDKHTRRRFFAAAN